MNYLLMVMTLFASGSMIGWVIELFFRRYLDPVERLKKKFCNPGFLAGPCLPIYGTGLVALYGLAHIRVPSLEVSHPVIHKLVVFLLMALAMTAIEFLAGMIFIVKLHVQLWDYTPYWGNIKGVICPLFSCFWYALAAFYYLVMHPRITAGLEWLGNNLACSFFIGFFYGVFMIDIVFSFNLVVKVKKLAEEYHIVVRYNAFKDKVSELKQEAKEKGAFFLTRLNTRSISDVFKDYRENFSVKKIVMAPIKAAKEKVDQVNELKDKITDKISDKITEYRGGADDIISNEDELQFSDTGTLITPEETSEQQEK